MIMRARDVVTDSIMSEISRENPVGHAEFENLVRFHIISFSQRINICLVVLDKLMEVFNSSRNASAWTLSLLQVNSTVTRPVLTPSLCFSGQTSPLQPWFGSSLLFLYPIRTWLRSLPLVSFWDQAGVNHLKCSLSAVSLKAYSNFRSCLQNQYIILQIELCEPLVLIFRMSKYNASHLKLAFEFVAFFVTHLWLSVTLQSCTRTSRLACQDHRQSVSMDKHSIKFE